MAIPEDALGELSLEVNMLADLLAEHRTGAIEATAFLQRVVEEVDIPMFAFDPREMLRLVNSAGERLIRQVSPNCLAKPRRSWAWKHVSRRRILRSLPWGSIATRAGLCVEARSGSVEFRTRWLSFPM